MGAAITSLADTAKLLRHNPIIILIGGLVMAAAAIFNGVMSTILGIIPIIGPLVANVIAVFVYTAAITGLLAIIYAGRHGNAGIGDFLQGLGDSYLQMLGAYFLILVPSFLLSILVTVIGVVVIGASLPQPGAEAGASMMAESGLILALLFGGLGLIYVLGYLLLQFFNIAIIAGDGVIESFKTSVSMALAAPLSTLGFTITKSLLGAILLGVPMVAVFVTGAGLAEMTNPGNPLGGGVLILGMFAYWLVAIPLWRVVSNTYHVAYFNRRQAAA